MQKMILKRLESNCYGSRSIEIYGGAYHLYNHGEPTLDDKIKCINNAVRNAQFFEPEIPAKTVALNMCHLLLTDPMLIQAYVGVRIW